MDNLKKLVIVLFVAVIGAFIGVSVYKYFEKEDGFTDRDSVPGRFATYSVKNVTLPSFDFSVIAEITTPAVVHIKTVTEAVQSNKKQPDFFDFDNPNDFFEYFMPKHPQYPQRASGSGVIISKDGYIVTNNHVIDGADDIEVSLSDKRIFKAEVVGRDKQTDIAVIKIDDKDLSFMNFGNSDSLKVGEWVIAVGNPFNLNSTVTAGIVSAKARNINILGGGTAIESFIQTDAAVNPGNSGGALINITGELIGINTAIASRTGQYAGYAFAIPSNLVLKVVSDIMKYGKVQRGLLGISIREVNEEIAEKAKLDKIKGVYVVDVMENSAAEAFGIKDGDIITRINKTKVNSIPELQEIVSRNRPGDKVSVTLMRKGEEKVLEVVLRDSRGRSEIIFGSSADLEDMVAARFEKIEQSELKRLNLENGVLVSSVGKGAFRNAGIPKGFIITKIDKVKVDDVDDIYVILRDNEDGVLIEGINPDGSKGYYGYGIK